MRSDAQSRLSRHRNSRRQVVARRTHHEDYCCRFAVFLLAPPDCARHHNNVHARAAAATPATRAKDFGIMPFRGFNPQSCEKNALENKQGREALEGAEAQTFDLFSEVLTKKRVGGDAVIST